jgi:hypothetical protein
MLNEAIADRTYCLCLVLSLRDVKTSSKLGEETSNSGVEPAGSYLQYVLREP